MSRRQTPKELRPLSHPENKKLKTSEELPILCDGQNSTCTSRDMQIHIPKPPKGHQKTVLMASVHKTQSADAVGNAVQDLLFHPVNLGPDSQPLDYAGPEGLRFDDQGMVLPHSILGSLDDFRSFLETRGEAELIKRIPKSLRDPPSEVPGRPHSEAVESGIPSSHRNVQRNALLHWHTHMRQRRRQQDLLSGLLHRPVENLLMNQANHFRDTQEQRTFLTQVMPLIHPGYGYHVGSEFWSLPQRYGDEMSGITATLTQTERGKCEPVTHVGQPSSVRQESGITCSEILRPASRTWKQSVYLQRQYQELGEFLWDMDIKKPDINGLEVIGSGKPFTSVTVRRGPLLEREGEEKKHKEMKKENLDPLAQYDDVQSNTLLIPALRFCGQLASWTGNSPSNQGQIGISATIIFEALTGERASSHLDLRNEGSTAIFFSWQQLPLPHSFPNLQSQTKTQHFYFDSSSGVILPGVTKRVEFIFKLEGPGIKTELWRFNTHPLLLQGASMQVTLRGLSLYQDKTADQRLFIQMKLEKIVRVKMCQSIVYEMLLGIHTPERPSSPAELYITEDQKFKSKNPMLQYLNEPVEDLKKLWQEANPGHPWDLSISTLRQVVLSLPEQASDQDSLTREKSLIQFNCLLLKLSEPLPQHHHLTAAAIGQQLWRKLLDMMADEAMQLKLLLCLPEKDTWVDKKDEPLISDSDLTDNINKDKGEKRGGAAVKEESKSATTEKSVEASKKKEKKKKDEMRKRSKEKQEESSSLTDIQPESVNQQPSDDQNVELEVIDIYTRLLHRKVYALMEDLVDTLCDLMDELNGDGR
ncbi:MYCBP-associated protein [Scomber scombrus]|uniref:MYCBP-associated protein n=1 Tax=Scomber scombrus TaxID=13677 RepID=A0AAV1PAA6_SCOSC